MKCPRCQMNKIDASGICLTCGYEVSQWKKKLEERLYAIRQKEEEIEQNLQSIIDAAVSRQSEYSSSPEYGDTPFMPQLKELAFLGPDNDEPALDLFVNTDTDAPDVSDTANAAYTDGTGFIRNDTDISDVEDIVYERSITDDGGIVHDEDITDDQDIIGIKSIPGDEYMARGESTPNCERIVDVEDVANVEIIMDDDDNSNHSPYILNATIPEGRLIFLSRTLSGLIDLLLIVLFAAVFLCMADFLTDAPMLNSINAINCSTLFLMIYFLYSVFFLGTNGQTLGMIVTDLRVESMNKKPLLLSQVVRRNASFLISLFGLGIGLLTGVISNECMCLHDRLSKTHVIRII